MHSPRFKTLIVILPLALGFAHAQGVLDPMQIDCEIRFANAPASTVGTRLLDLAGPGATSFQIYADSNEVPSRQSQIFGPMGVGDTRLGGGPFSLTVDSTGLPGYTLSPRLGLDVTDQTYIFENANTGPAVSGGTFSHVASETVSIIRLEFVDASGNPSPITDASIVCEQTDPLPVVTRGLISGLGAAAVPRTSLDFVVPANRPFSLNVFVEIGSGGALGTGRRVGGVISDWAVTGVAGDVIVSRNFNVDSTGAGSLSGTFDVLGEFEVSAATADPRFGGYTGINAYNYDSTGTGTGYRRRVLPGTNFAAPSSGSYLLDALTTTSGTGLTYSVFADGYLRRTFSDGSLGIQYFRTPFLSNDPTIPADPLTVPDGADASLGNALVIDPGTIRGTLSLHGPSEIAGQPPILGGVISVAQHDADNDGLPDGDYSDPVSWTAASSVVLTGSDTIATGADFAASNGEAYAPLRGSYTSATRLYTTPYEVVVGGLKSQPSVWRSPNLTFIASAPGGVIDEAGYFYNSHYIVPAVPADLEVTAGSDTVRDIEIPMGELCLTVRSNDPATTFYQPTINNQAFTGAPGNDWLVQPTAYGWPTSLEEAGVRGSLRAVLPAGTYTFSPLVNSVVGGESTGITALSAITVTVPDGGRVCVENGLSLTAVVPPCTDGVGETVTGTVGSGGTMISEIAYQIDGGAWVIVCAGCGADPTYLFALPAGLTPGTHNLKIRVTAVDGRVITFDQDYTMDTAPPTFTPPADILAGCSNVPLEVFFPPLNAIDDCPGPVTVTFDPPSGTFFPVGSTPVNVTVTDDAGNVATDVFIVTVGDGGLTIVPAVLLTWSCGVLQESTDMENWTDLPGAVSPFTAPTDGIPKKFWRIKP